MTVTPLGWDQDCSLKIREPEVPAPFWFLDPGGWSKTAAVGLYFIFPGICTLSLVKVLGIRPLTIWLDSGNGIIRRYGLVGVGVTLLEEVCHCGACIAGSGKMRARLQKRGFRVSSCFISRSPQTKLYDIFSKLCVNSSQIRPLPYPSNCGTSSSSPIMSSIFWVGCMAMHLRLLELSLAFDCGSLYLLPSVTGEELYDDRVFTYLITGWYDEEIIT
ncbi:hypothetical protein STEG23_002951, partial [Scotinomys teguina]